MVHLGCPEEIRQWIEQVVGSSGWRWQGTGSELEGVDLGSKGVLQIIS